MQGGWKSSDRTGLTERVLENVSETFRRKHEVISPKEKLIGSGWVIETFDGLSPGES